MEDKLKNIRCEAETKAYIKNIFKEYIRAEKDLSNSSITILYAKAKNNFKFEQFQNIGDYLFFIKSIYPDYLSGASQNYFDIIAQNSYYKCYLILNRQWKVFEELSDSFPHLVDQVQIATKDLI